MKKHICCAQSNKEFVIAKAQTHGPGCDATYCSSEPSVIPFSYPGAPESP